MTKNIFEIEDYSIIFIKIIKNHYLKNREFLIQNDFDLFFNEYNNKKIKDLFLNELKKTDDKNYETFQKMSVSDLFLLMKNNSKEKFYSYFYFLNMNKLKKDLNNDDLNYSYESYIYRMDESVDFCEGLYNEDKENLTLGKFNKLEQDLLNLFLEHIKNHMDKKNKYELPSHLVYLFISNRSIQYRKKLSNYLIKKNYIINYHEYSSHETFKISKPNILDKLIFSYNILTNKEIKNG